MYSIHWLHFIQWALIKYVTIPKTFSILFNTISLKPFGVQIQFMFCFYVNIIGIILHVGRNLVNNAPDEIL